MVGRQFEKEEILEIFVRVNNDSIIKEYTLQELGQMHLAIFDCKPLSKNKNKKDIIESIRNFIYRMNRANSF